MRIRRAVSLVELLVVMSACSVILSMSGVLVHRAMHAQSKTRSFFDVERSAWRLSDQFRRDVHQAIGLVAGDAELGEGVFLRIQLPDDQSVEYRRQEGNVQRVLSRNAAGVSHEEFLFPPAIELAIREEESPRRLTLSITTASSTSAREGGQAHFAPKTTQNEPDPDRSPPWNPHAMPVSFQAEAVPGRDWRFSQLAGGEEVPE